MRVLFTNLQASEGRQIHERSSGKIFFRKVEKNAEEF